MKGLVSWRIKLLYGTGAAADSIKNFAFGNLLLLYYNQVLGVSGTLSGIAVAIAVAFDAITDPAVGSWSDGFRHRLGRRHLFMAVSIVPLALTFFFLFWPPQGLGEWGTFAWLTIFAVLCRTALTFFHVPFMSLGAEMTPDYQERSQIAAVRTGLGMTASLLVVVLTWNVVFVETPDVPTPQLVRDAYFGFAIITAGVMTVMMTISTWGTLSLIPHLSRVREDHPGFSLPRVYTDILQAMKNRDFSALFWGSLLFAVFMGVHAALSMHTKTFFWELDTTSIQLIQYANILGGIGGLFLLGWFHRVFDKRLTLIMGVVAYSITITAPIVLKISGLMTSDPMVVRWLLIVMGIIGYAGIIHAGVTGMSMMGDIADEHELRHGVRQEGVYFGSHNFALKCTTALGNLLAGFGLDLVSFPANAVPGEVASAVLFDYGLFSALLVVMAVIGIVVFLPYRLDRQRHAAIRVALDNKAATDSTDAANTTVRYDR